MDERHTHGGLEARGPESPAGRENRYELERRRRPDRRQTERRRGDRRGTGEEAVAAPAPRPRGRLRRLRSRASLVIEVKDRVAEDHVAIVAAGVAFSFFLSIFPTLFAAVSIYGLVANAQTMESHLSWLSGLLPREALALVRGQLHAVAAAPRTALQWGTAISVLIALWSAASGSAALIEALNIARDVKEHRGFIHLRATALAFSLGFVLFLILSATLIAAVPNVLANVPLADSFRMASQLAQWAVLMTLILLALKAVYRFAPARSAASHRWVTAGTVGAALLWLAASALFSWYAASFGRFDKTHGALAGVVVLLLWLQISCLVVLIGAELDAVLERRRAAAAAGLIPSLH